MRPLTQRLHAILQANRTSQFNSLMNRLATKLPSKPSLSISNRSLLRCLAMGSLLCLIPVPGPINGADIAAKAAPALSGKLFDGKSLTGWKVTPFGGTGEVAVKNGSIDLEMGYMTGVTWTNSFPTQSYEVTLEAQRTNGTDFFCGLTFPVKDSHVTLIIGGWGGALVGISSINGQDASENETTKFQKFDKNRWYKVRVRVALPKVQAWIDDENFVDLDTTGKTLALRPGDTELCRPFGIATWSTGASIKNIELKLLAPDKKPDIAPPAK